MNTQYGLKKQDTRDAENLLLCVKKTVHSSWSQAATRLRRYLSWGWSYMVELKIELINLYFSFIFDIFFAAPFKLFMLNGDFFVSFL